MESAIGHHVQKLRICKLQNKREYMRKPSLRQKVAIEPTARESFTSPAAARFQRFPASPHLQNRTIVQMAGVVKPVAIGK
jgi:hypothetical protein